MKRLIAFAAVALACAAAFGLGSGTGGKITNIVYDKGEWVVDTDWTLDTNDIICVDYDLTGRRGAKFYYSDGVTNRVKAPFPNKSEHEYISVSVRHMHKFYYHRTVFNRETWKHEILHLWEWRMDANCYIHREETILFGADGAPLWGCDDLDWPTNRVEIIKRPNVFILQ